MTLSGWLALGVLSWLLIALPGVLALYKVANVKARAFLRMSSAWIFGSLLFFAVASFMTPLANTFTYMLMVGIPLVLGFYGTFPTSKYPNIKTTAVLLMGGSFLMLLLFGGYISNQVTIYVGI